MSDTKSEQEPTMEEILASIRRIISDEEAADGEAEPATAEAEVPPEPEVVEEDEDEDTGEVLDLTEVVNQDGTITTLNEDEPVDVEPEVDDVPEDDEDLAPDAPEPEIEEAPAFEAPAETNANGIVSDIAAGEAANSLASLAGAVSVTRSVPLGAGDKTLEDIIKELLRPLLKDWLDENLPLLVERLVEREIHRISGRAEDD